MVGWLITGWAVAGALLLVLWFVNSNYGRQLKGIAGYIRSWLNYDSFEVKFRSAIKEYVDTHKTDGPAFTALNQVIKDLAKTPAVYAAAADKIARCRVSAVGEFAANGLELHIYSNGTIVISTEPYVYRLFGADGSVLPADPNGSVYTTSELRTALEAADAVFASVTLPDETPIGGTVEVIRAKVAA